MRDDRDFHAVLIGNGTQLIAFTGICLALSGVFVIFQAMTGHFLPHDLEYLQMSPQVLCGVNECRIVHFMIHDRISFGGAILAIGVIYLWLAAFPITHGERWAWWLLLLSGVTGFGSFLNYLGYGYLDTWHGLATLALLPCFVGGMWLSWPRVPSDNRPPRSAHAFQPGRWCLLIASVGMIGAGVTIQLIGMTTVFVPTDLEFMGLERATLDAINPRLVPLIAHDRAGFGGAVATAGLLTVGIVWFGELSRSMWQALAIAGLIGWSTSIGVHPAIGYTNAMHLGPAVTGATLYFIGLALWRPRSAWEGDTQ